MERGEASLDVGGAEAALPLSALSSSGSPLEETPHEDVEESAVYRCAGCNGFGAWRCDLWTGCDGADEQHYLQTNLVSNLASLAPTVDASLVNAWGLSRSSKSPWWVADNGTGMSTLYNGTGVKQGLIVTIPSGDPGVSPTGTPTGTVYNGDSTAFLLAPGKAAAFLFVTEDGTISGWNPGVSAGHVRDYGEPQERVGL